MWRCTSTLQSCTTTLLRALSMTLSMKRMLCDGLSVDSPKAAALSRGLTPSIPLSASEDDVTCDEDNLDDEESRAADPEDGDLGRKLAASLASSSSSSLSVSDTAYPER